MSGLSYMQEQLMQRLSPLEKTAENAYCARITFEPGFPGFDGHFPGRPVVPAICQLSVVEIMARLITGCRDARVREILNMKFKAPLLQGDTASFAASVDRAGDSVPVIRAVVSTQSRQDVARMRLALDLEK